MIHGFELYLYLYKVTYGINLINDLFLENIDQAKNSFNKYHGLNRTLL